MKIKSITIEQLFGGEIPYHLELMCEEGVIILHAQNGMGKTTVLSMVPAIVFANYQFLNSTPFKKATLELEDGTIINVEKKSVFDSILDFDVENEEIPYAYDTEEIQIERRRRKNEIKYTVIPIGEKEFSSHINPPTRPERVIHSRMQAVDSSVPIPLRRRYLMGVFNKPDFVESYIQITRDLAINFIKADRLYVDSRESRSFARGRHYSSQEIEQEGNIKIEAITECAYDLRERINAVKRRKEEVSEGLDRTFPKRVVDHYKNNNNLDEDNIRDQLQQLEEKRKELENIGLINDENESGTFSSSEEFPKDSLPVLEIYIEDNNKKLAAYNKLKRQIDLLLKAINESNAFSKKKLVIDTTSAQFAMKFIAEGNEGREIPLERLSSGEKHALILFYRLIFNSKEGSLVMIDEPEISLHISWQQHFITSLLEICRENMLYAVVATHSPDIVMGHYELLVNLDGSPVDDDEEEE